MANINIDAILKKVEAYAHSDDGQKRMNATIEKLHKSGVKKTKAGSELISQDRMRQAANLMIEILQEEAASANLPQSVRDHFDSLQASNPVQMDNTYYVSIYFEDDLSRPSLMITSGRHRGHRTGEGISNIVSLFDTGYQASQSVYGHWDSHPEVANVRSLKERPGKYFMEKAVSRFNSMYGREYGAEAMINSAEFYSLFNSPLEDFDE